jgi:hypothetical protein
MQGSSMLETLVSQATSQKASVHAAEEGTAGEGVTETKSDMAPMESQHPSPPFPPELVAGTRSVDKQTAPHDITPPENRLAGRPYTNPIIQALGERILPEDDLVKRGKTERRAIMWYDEPAQAYGPTHHPHPPPPPPPRSQADAGYHYDSDDYSEQDDLPSPPRRAPPPNPPRHRRFSTDAEDHYYSDDYLERHLPLPRRRAPPVSLSVYPTWDSPVRTSDPPVLTLFWACQIDVEIGPWATPWAYGMFQQCLDALDMIGEIALTGLMNMVKQAIKPIETTVQVNKEIRFVTFSNSVTFKELWASLRNSNHTWPPYALNARGGVTEPEPHETVKFTAFPDDEELPPLLLSQSVRDSLTDEAKKSDKTFTRDRTIELASLDYWLANAAKTESIERSKKNLLQNVPAIIEELWVHFGHPLMDAVEQKWHPDGSDQYVQELADLMSRYLKSACALDPAEQHFVWVAFLRAIKVMQCIKDGPETDLVRSHFEDDILVYLA